MTAKTPVVEDGRFGLPALLAIWGSLRWCSCYRCPLFPVDETRYLTSPGDATERAVVAADAQRGTLLA